MTGAATLLLPPSHTAIPLGPSRPPRLLLYSHDGCGLGHLRRNLNLAAAVVEACPSASVLVATGSEAVGACTIPPSVDVLRLPGLRKLGNDNYSARRLPVAGGEVRALRAAVLAAAVESFRPDVLLADKHPAGVRGELVPALEALRAAGGRAALGLRDVLDGAAEAQRAWREGALGATRRHHDLVLVYGDRGLLDPVAGSGLEEGRGPEVRYCGYVAPSDHPVHPRPAFKARRGRPLVVGCAGGGEDGNVALAALVDAARGAPWDAIVVTGPNAGAAEGARLRASAAANTSVVTSVPELGGRLGLAGAVVCMGGYNTLVEVMAAAVPAVCVPRVSPRCEQLVRATALAERGLLRVVPPGDLTVGRLRAAIDAALATDRAALARRVAATVRLDGRRRAAAALLALAGASTRPG